VRCTTNESALTLVSCGAQAERDQALNGKKKAFEKSGQKLRSESAKIEQEIERATQKKVECEEKIAKLEGNSSFDEKSNEHAKKLEQMRRQEIDLNSKIRELQKKQQECEKESLKLKSDLEGMDSKLSHGMPNGTARAIRFLDDYCKQHNVSKSPHPLILSVCMHARTCPYMQLLLRDRSHTHTHTNNDIHSAPKTVRGMVTFCRGFALLRVSVCGGAGPRLLRPAHPPDPVQGCLLHGSGASRRAADVERSCRG